MRTPLRRVVASASIVLAGVMMTSVGTPSASALWSSNCYGFSSCSTSGYATFGYSANRDRSFWNMAPRQCTNYVAYRFAARGVKAPSVYPGNANQWGVRLKSVGYTVNSTPRVGSIALWTTGTYGHLGYVQKVTRTSSGALQITFTEDNFSLNGGAATFSWRTITQGDPTWPNGGFIHYADERVKMNGTPYVTGTTRVGRTLTAVTYSTNVWSRVSYQWYRNGIAIPGATGKSFTATSYDVGRRLSVRVVAANSTYLSYSKVVAASTLVTR